jgi:predicted O-methyltransferase YrrM
MKKASDDVGFLRVYQAAFGSIVGFFFFDAALMFMAYHQLIAEDGIAGDTLEIGVHHGLSAIAVAALAGNGREFVAIDLFEDLQEQNVSRSGGGHKATFLENMERAFGDIGFVRTLVCRSSDIRPHDLGASRFSFCHIDGGHSAEETYHDFALCHQILVDGGLLAVDDYFNPAWPGVSEGSIGFMRDHPSALIPLAVGFNKVLFQKAPAPRPLNAAFAAAFPSVPKTVVTLWGAEARLLAPTLLPYVDLTHSTPRRLVPREGAPMRARLEPRVERLTAAPDDVVSLPVLVTNESAIPFTASGAALGLSYHLADAEGAMVSFDNRRSYFTDPLPPGSERLVELAVRAPKASGSYQLEIDIVWEGIMWFKDRGNKTSTVELTVA